MIKEYILFDLDGTLTDPKMGITKSVQYALEKMGIKEENLDVLEPFIGPPLKDSFIEFYKMEEEQAKEAIGFYRERFEKIGLYENKLYPRIAYLLKRLKANDMKIAIASSKPTVFVERILKHFEIHSYFDVIVGSELDGTRVEKPEIIKEALNQLFEGKPMQRDKVVMIGDRKFDIQGAKSWVIESIGVTYGYGGEEELKKAGATYIVKSVNELLQMLLPKEAKVRKEPLMQKVFLIAIPFFIFIVVRQLAVYIGYYGVSALLATAENGRNTLASTVGETIILTSLGEAVLSVFSFVTAGVTTWALNRGFFLKLEHQVKKIHKEKISILEWCLMILIAIFGAFGINLLLSLSGFVALFTDYAEIAIKQNDISITMGIIVYAIVAPFSEELLFRGIIYQRMTRMYSVSVGIIGSSLLFAVYHGNVVQGVFAFIMGCFIAYFYEKYDDLRVPIVIHSAINLTSFLINAYGAKVSQLFHIITCIVSCAVAIVLFMVMKKIKRRTI